MKARTLAALGAVVVLLAAVPASAGAVTLIGSGSSAAQPYLLALFKGYGKVHPHVKFVYTPNGGNAGVKDVQAGRSQFAAQARPPLPSDAGTTYVKLFLDGLCIVVNPRNQLRHISIRNTRNIYEGLTTSWSAFPASGLSTTIDAVGRDSNGGTYNFFSSAVLNGQAPASNVNALLSDGLVANAVARDPNAIGYAGLGHVAHNRKVKALRLNNIACAPSQIKTLRYPLSRFIFIVFPTANPSPDVKRFADWVRTSPAAGTIIAKVGGVPAFNKPAKKKHHRKHRRRT